MAILLITGTQLAKGSPLGGNIDIDKYTFVIEEAQIFVIENLLGTKLFEKILTDFDASTITGIYSTLLTKYIQPILIKHVAAEHIIASGFNVANGGILRYSDENNTPATKSEIDFLANNERKKADVYIERMIRFLCDQRANIPEYTSAQDNNFDIRPDKHMTTFAGLRLDMVDRASTNAHREILRDILFDEGRR